MALRPILVFSGDADGVVTRHTAGPACVTEAFAKLADGVTVMMRYGQPPGTVSVRATVGA